MKNIFHISFKWQIYLLCLTVFPCAFYDYASRHEIQDKVFVFILKSNLKLSVIGFPIHIPRFHFPFLF